MASLVLRGQVWHLAWRWRGRLKFKSTGVRHDGRYRDGKPIQPAAAKRELRKLETSLDQGHSYESKTLADLLDLVEKEYEIAGYRSAASLKSRLQHLKDWFGNLRADRINETDFLEYADFRRKADRPAENATINRELEVLMKALRLGKINPLPTLKKLPASAPRQGFFDDAKIASLCRKLPEYLRAPTMFGYMTGWRREEVFGLEKGAVDFEAGEVRLWTSKNELPRVFPMDVVPGLRNLLTEAVAATNKTPAIAVGDSKVFTVTPYVFPHRFKDGSFGRIVDFRKAWTTACKAAGCPGMLFHDLRRSAGRTLELAGWPRTLIMSWMGHESESMFHRYRIMSAADREIVSKRLAEIKKAVGGN